MGIFQKHHFSKHFVKYKYMKMPFSYTFIYIPSLITEKVKKKAISAFRRWGNINTLPKLNALRTHSDASESILQKSTLPG